MDINELSRIGISWTSSNMFDDNIWKLFGFRKCPARGKLFNYFISNQRLAIEEFIHQELFALTLIDIAQAVKQIDKYKTSFIDYRITLILGIISYYWVYKGTDDFENLIKRIKDVNEYTSDPSSNNIRDTFVSRFSFDANLEGEKKVRMTVAATMLLGKSTQEKGLLGSHSTYNEILKGYKPTGYLPKLLTGTNFEQAVQMSHELINTDIR